MSVVAVGRKAQDVIVWSITVGELLGKLVGVAIELFEKIRNWCQGNGYVNDTQLKLSNIQEMNRKLSPDEKAKIRALLGLD